MCVTNDTSGDGQCIPNVQIEKTKSPGLNKIKCLSSADLRIVPT